MTRPENVERMSTASDGKRPRGERRRRILTARTLEASSRVIVCLPLPRLPPLTSPLLARCCRARLVLLSGESTFEHTTGAVEKDRAAVWCSWRTAEASIGRADVNDMMGVRIGDEPASSAQDELREENLFPESRKSTPDSKRLYRATRVFSLAT